MKGQKIKWTEELLEQVRIRFPNEQSRKLAEDLKINYYTLNNIAFRLQVKKSEEYLNGPNSGRLLGQRGLKTRFPKGHVPANKGQKMSEELKEKCKHTFFPKGNKPHNTKEPGTIVITQDKNGHYYQRIKISDSNWKALQRVVWETVNGEIPKGCKIRFKDGNTLNCNIDNLELISSAELLKRNQITNYPPEIIEIIKLKNLLKRKIKSYGKKQN